MPTKCDVILIEVAEDKEIAVVKALYKILSLSPRDAENLVKSIPTVIFKNASIQEAEKLKQELENIGSKVDIQAYKSDNIFSNLDFSSANVLSEYYIHLSTIELNYTTLLEAKNELEWYESKLKEADILTINIPICKSSNIEVKSLTLPNKLDRSVIDNKLTNITNIIQQYHNIKKTSQHTRSRIQQEMKNTILTLQNQQHETISELQKQLNNNLSNLYKQRDDVIYNLQQELNHLQMISEQNIEDTENEINTKIKKIDKLKTKIMLEVILIVVTGVGIGIITQNLTAIAVSVILVCSISSLISTDYFQ